MILWNAGVTLRKKVILCCVFSATVAIMAVALIRVTVVNSRHTNVDIAWLYFWTYVENGIGESIPSQRAPQQNSPIHSYNDSMRCIFPTALRGVFRGTLSTCFYRQGSFFD